jgi:hypothetical protein
MSTNNLLIHLAENHRILTQDGPYDKSTHCSTPLADSRTFSRLESDADCVCHDVKNSLHALAQLVTSDPSDIGDEDTLMPQVGVMIRLLGQTLEFAMDAKDAAGTRIWTHQHIELEKTKAASKGGAA